jgi:hypothetical protein
MRGEAIIKSAVVVLLWGLAATASATKYGGQRGWKCEARVENSNVRAGS